MTSSDKPLTTGKITRSVMKGRIIGGLVAALIIGPALWYFFGPKIGHEEKVQPDYTRLVSIDPKYFKVEAAKGKFEYAVDISDYWKIKTGLGDEVDSVANFFSKAAHQQKAKLQGKAGMAMEVKLPQGNKVRAKVSHASKTITLDLENPFASKENITWDVAKAGGYQVKDVNRAIGDHLYNLFGNQEINLQPGFAEAEQQIMNQALSKKNYPRLLAASRKAIQNNLIDGFLEQFVNLVDPKGNWNIVVNWKKPNIKSILSGT